MRSDRGRPPPEGGGWRRCSCRESNAASCGASGPRETGSCSPLEEDEEEEEDEEDEDRWRFFFLCFFLCFLLCFSFLCFDCAGRSRSARQSVGV